MEAAVGRWRSFLPDEEAFAYRQAGFGEPSSVRGQPALLVVDCTIAFTGRHAGQSLEEAVAEFPTACGPAAWEALPAIRQLLSTCRERSLPVVFSRSDLSVIDTLGGATKAAGRRGDRGLPDAMRLGSAFPDDLEPSSDEWVLEKSRASVFFATPLASYLQVSGVGSVIICGTTTSGCVRASAVDAFSHGFETFVVEDACFDRSPTAHDANLWDMHAKYASVLTLEEMQKALADL